MTSLTSVAAQRAPLLTPASSTTSAGAQATLAPAADPSLTADDADAGSVGDRIDGLLQQQVSSGALTSDQAGALQSFLSQGTPPSGGAAPASGGAADGVAGVAGATGAGGAGRVHHGGGHGHHKAASTTDTDTDATDPNDLLSTSTSTAATQSGDPSNPLDQLLDTLRQSLASNLTYGDGGAAGTPPSGLVVNAKA